VPALGTAQSSCDREDFGATDAEAPQRVRRQLDCNLALAKNGFGSQVA
jgi:hypothetical protein